MSPFVFANELNHNPLKSLNYLLPSDSNGKVRSMSMGVENFLSSINLVSAAMGGLVGAIMPIIKMHYDRKSSKEKMITYERQQENIISSQEKIAKDVQSHEKKMVDLQKNVRRNYEIEKMIFNKKREVYNKIYSDLSMVQYLLRRFIVPVGSFEISGNKKDIEDAKAKLIDAYIYLINNDLYIENSTSEKMYSSISKFIESSNSYLNVHESVSDNHESWTYCAKEITQQMYPIVAKFKEDIRNDLGLDRNVYL